MNTDKHRYAQWFANSKGVGAGWGRAGWGMVFLAVTVGMVLVGAESVRAAEAVVDPAVKQFDELCAKVQQNPAAATEAEVRQLLDAGLKLGRPYTAHLASRTFLARQMQPSADLLRLGAQAAEMAGDYRTAAARYKAVLAAAPDDAASSEMAGALYETLVLQLQSADDAYETMTRWGERFRQSARTRQFDLWYLSEARRRGDVVNHAKRMLLVMNAKMPVDLERLHYGPDLNWLMRTVSQGRPTQFGAVEACTAILALIREDPKRQAEYGLYVARLRHKAAVQGKELPEADKLFTEIVAPAANAYITAVPTAAAMKNIVTIFFGGHEGADGSEIHTLQRKEKGEFFLAAFPKLNAADKEEIYNWNWHVWIFPHLAGAKMFPLAATIPDIVKRSNATRNFWFDYDVRDTAQYQAQMKLLDGLPGRYVAEINAMAVGGDDLAAAARQVLEKESWSLAPEEIREVLLSDLTSLFSRYTRATPLAGDYLPKYLVATGDQLFLKTPQPVFDPVGTRDHMKRAFDLEGLDKAPMIARLHGLDWIPLTQPQREEIFGQAYDAFKKWVEDVRTKQAAAKDETEKAALTKALAQVSAVETAFKAVMDPRVADVNKAPDALCKAIGQALQAIQARKLEDYVKAADAAYAVVRDYSTKRTPFGRAVLTFLLTNRLEAFDTIDWQCQVLADQIAQYDPARSTWAIEDARLVVYNRKEWGDGYIPQADQPLARKLNTMYAAAMMKELDQKKVWPALFYWMGGTRYSNRGWTDWKLNGDVFARMIEERTLLEPVWRPTYANGVSAYLWLLRNQYPEVRGKYSPDTYFDDMYVEDFQKRGIFNDAEYWNYGYDKLHKVANAGAKLLATFDRLPFGYAPDKPACDPAVFWNWSSTVARADKEARDEYTKATEATYGKTRFDDYAMGRLYFTTDANVKSAEGRKLYFDRWRDYLTKASGQAAMLTPPTAITLNDVEVRTLTTEETAALARALIELQPRTWPTGWNYETLASHVITGLAKGQDWKTMRRAWPVAWRVARDCNAVPLQRALVQATRDLESGGQADLAAAASQMGLDILGTSAAEDIRVALSGLRTKALSDVGGGVIPADRSDPRYPIFASQAAFLAGKEEAAWDLYSSHAPQAGNMVRELDPQYALWLVQRNTQTQAFEAAEALARLLIQWVDAAPAGFELEMRVRIMLAYADIAFARQEYPRARALYQRITAASELAATRGIILAELRIADVDRATRQFDQASERLERLVRRADRSVLADVWYTMANLRFDQQDFPGAMEAIQQVFTYAPGHESGRVLEGKLHLALRKLTEATQVKVGAASDKRFIAPGKPLKIELEDMNLAVTAGAAQVNVRVWTSGGDEETLFLLPFGDSRTKFEGELATQQGAAKKGDRILELLGNDKVWYAYASQTDKSAPPLGELQVIADAELYASAGQILSKEEREERALEEQIRYQLSRRSGDDPTLEFQIRRRDDQIRPGNPVNIRVVDSDRNVTAGPDKIVVRVSASSGDRIDAFELTETGPVTGIFEGAVPSATAQAMAYASDSEEGREPSFVISADEYPAWVGSPDNVRPKTFSVDLNDNVALGTMTVIANVPGRKLRDFLVQTSINGRDFATVGSWPKKYEPWDGAPRLQIVRFPENRPPRTIAEIKSYLELGYITKGAPKALVKPKRIAAQWDREVGGLAGNLRLEWPDWYIAHFSAAFFLDKPQVRTFKIDHQNQVKNIQYTLTLDDQAGEDRYQVTRSLGRGVHRIDMYVAAYRHANPKFELLCDTPEPPYLQPVPMDMLDPAQHPEITRALVNPPAEVTGTTEDTQFDIKFNTGTQARVVRLVLADFETDAPAIAKVRLTDAENRPVLPTKSDFLKLRQNQTLEIVPGDRVAVSYEDPRFISSGKQFHEAFLSASFSDARISPCYVEFNRYDRSRQNPIFVPMRRFVPGEAIKVLISDPDADVSDAADVATFSVRVADRPAVKLKALEQHEHAGVFVGTINPVTTAAQHENDVQVAVNEDLVVAYIDRENTDPGIPWERSARIEQAWSIKPELRTYDHQTAEWSPPAAAVGSEKGANKDTAGVNMDRKVIEYVPVRRTLAATISAAAQTNAAPGHVLVDGPLMVEVRHPSAALSARSEVELFAQTSTGRAALGRAPQEPFDVAVPGTVRLRTTLTPRFQLTTPPGYAPMAVRGMPSFEAALEEGRFSAVVPMVLGDVPEKTLIHEDPLTLAGEEPSPLYISGGDEIFLGYKYKDADGKEAWITQKVTLTTDVFFDVMDRRYNEALTAAHLGDTIYFRVIHKSKDVSNEKDTITLKVVKPDGSAQAVELNETFGHSGVFKGLVQLGYGGAAEVKTADAKSKAPAGSAEAKPAVAAMAGGAGGGMVLADYGQMLKVVYEPGEGQAAVERAVEVYKGGDGGVAAFTKQFKDASVGLQTQFTIAEAYLELAKRHRDLGEEEVAKKEIAEGKRLLEEAIRDYPEAEARAQAEYLLAELALEFAREAGATEGAEKQHFLEAIARFSQIVAGYPDSTYAPKAQFKKALTLEKMGEIDQACEEYVKLSYRYPDNELVAETIARLGQYFLTKGKDLDAEMEKASDKVAKEKLKLQGKEMFTTAGQVFGRLAERFPTHHLADKTTVLSAQCFMRAEDYRKAIDVYRRVYTNPKSDNELASESMYWAADSFTKMGNMIEAYRTFKKLTWDYPESKWAKFARGRLTDPQLLSVAEADVQD